MSTAQLVGVAGLLTLLFAFPYVLHRMAQIGVWASLRNPSSNEPPLADWAVRARRAHANAVENVVAFAPLALACIASGLGGG